MTGGGRPPTTMPHALPEDVGGPSGPCHVGVGGTRVKPAATRSFGRRSSFGDSSVSGTHRIVSLRGGAKQRRRDSTCSISGNAISHPPVGVIAKRTLRLFWERHRRAEFVHARMACIGQPVAAVRAG